MPCRSKSKDLVHCLELCLDLWYHGDIEALVKEDRCIQDHMQSTIHLGLKSNVAKNFTSLCHWVRLLLPLNFF